jgi:hypothetical protein
MSAICERGRAAEAHRVPAERETPCARPPPLRIKFLL